MDQDSDSFTFKTNVNVNMENKTEQNNPDHTGTTSTPQETLASHKIINDTDVDDYFKAIMPKVASAVKASNMLPNGEQYEFYTTYPEFLETMEDEGCRALELLSYLLRQNGIRASGTLTSQAEGIDVEDKFETLIDANDQLTERISNRLDEFEGIRKEPATELVVSSTPQSKSTPRAATWNSTKKSSEKDSRGSYRLLAARFVQRPQTKFKEKVDNSDTPFYPKLTHKPHAILPLRESLQLPTQEGQQAQAAPNPYKYEIERFSYTQQQLTATANPQMPKPLQESGPHTYIDTVEQLERLMEDLRVVKEIAVDLEAHSYRSFQGLTCLMQLSTRTHDYIVDTLALRSELQVLNEVFTDPTVVKVLHGADSDIEWLQRDLSVYIVNMFDTHIASKLLAFSRHSLAYLLKHYCHVEADKQYQLADWRIRPLPEELLNYAREDTHYLLYIYDMMRNSLLDRGNQQKNLLLSVLDNSRLLTAKVYRKPTLADEGYHDLYTRSRKSFNSRQMMALVKLYEWRFRLAQQEDESQGFILPNHIMLQICEVLPREPSGVLACCTPIPPLVRQHLHAIHSLVKEAREQPLTAAQTIRTEATLQAKVTRTLLDSPHDSPSDIRSPSNQLPGYAVKPGKVEVKQTPSWSVFSHSLVNSVTEKVKKLKESFITPLSHYNPLKYIDYMSILIASQTEDQSCPGDDPVTPADSANNTLSSDSESLKRLSADPSESPSVKRSRVESVSSVPPGDGVGENLEEGEIEEVIRLTKKEKRKRRKVNEAAQKAQPMRYRPASNPEKKLVKPDSEFKPYDYSTADYSEFKPPQPPKLKKSSKHKNQKSNNFRADAGKSFTYKR